jgi:High potential iron-sulfur protein
LRDGSAAVAEQCRRPIPGGPISGEIMSINNNSNDSSSNPHRRVFVLGVAGTLAAASAGVATAQAPMVDEKDPQGAALGYRADTTKVDAAKYPKHTNEQKCTNCQVFQGKATDASGPCALFPGKQVAGAGWCSAWVKKVG